MLQTFIIGSTLMVLSVIPLLFLIYTLTHLEQLEIGLSHPRVVVELLIFIVLFVIGLFIVI